MYKYPSFIWSVSFGNILGLWIIYKFKLKKKKKKKKKRVRKEGLSHLVFFPKDARLCLLLGDLMVRLSY